MICLDCSHAIIRTLILVDGEESFFSCDLDGQILIIPVKECSRYAKAVVPIKEQVTMEQKWNKGRR